MTMDSRCPPDVEHLADEYCLGRLDLEVAAAFEDHYLTCPPCAEVASDAGAFVEVFRLAALQTPRNFEFT